MARLARRRPGNDLPPEPFLPPQPPSKRDSMHGPVPMALFQSTWVVLGASLLLYGGSRAWMWIRVRTRRLGAPRIRSATPADLPGLLDPLFEAARKELAPLGFSLAGARWIESMDVCEGPRPERVYRHPSGTLAFVGPPLPGDGERPYRLTFVSRTGEGPVVATFDGAAGPTRGHPPGWRCTERDEPAPERQWRRHVDSLGPLGGLGAAVDTPLDAWNRLERRALADVLRDWEARGRTRRTGADGGRRPRWRFRPRAAWSLGCRILRGQRSAFAREAGQARHRARQELWRSNAETRAEDPVGSRDAARAAAMAWVFRYEHAARACRAAGRGARHRVAVGLATAGAGLGGLAVWLGWPVAAVVAAVLALHELGHAAGAAWLGTPAGRRRLSAARASDARDGTRRPAPAPRAAIALLGPAPGLLLGLAALYVFADGGGRGWFLVAVVALTVNYVNLLPILPLDGGRVVEALLLDRIPRAQVALLALGAAAVGLAAWRLHDLVLAALALALLLAMKLARPAADALSRARASTHARMTESDRVLAVFETLQEAPFAELAVARRQRIAELIVPRLEGRRASRRAALAGAAVYLSLVVGVPAAVTTVLAVDRSSVSTAVIEEAPAEADQSSAVRISETSLVGR